MDSFLNRLASIMGQHCTRQLKSCDHRLGVKRRRCWSSGVLQCEIQPLMSMSNLLSAPQPLRVTTHKGGYEVHFCLVKIIRTIITYVNYLVALLHRCEWQVTAIDFHAISTVATSGLSLHRH